MSAKYLKTVYGVLTDPQEKTGPVAGLAAWWRSLKDAGGLDEEKKQAAYMAEWVHAMRGITRPVFPNLIIPGMDIGSQPFPIWKVRQIEATRFAYLSGSGLKMPKIFYVEDTPAAAAMKVPKKRPRWPSMRKPLSDLPRSSRMNTW